MADHGDRPTADELIGDALRALNSSMTARIRPDFVDLSVAANRQKLIAETWPPSDLELYLITVVDGLKARVAELERYVGVVERHLSQALARSPYALVHDRKGMPMQGDYMKAMADIKGVYPSIENDPKIEAEIVARRNAAMAEALKQSKPIAAVEVLKKAGALPEATHATPLPAKAMR